MVVIGQGGGERSNGKVGGHITGGGAEGEVEFVGFCNTLQIKCSMQFHIHYLTNLLTDNNKDKSAISLLHSH